MIFKFENWSKIYQDIINKDKEFQKILKIVKANTQGGKIWIIGGYVYKTIIEHAYGMPSSKKTKDYDFLIEKPNSEITLPFTWYEMHNKFGNSKFRKVFSRKSIDFVPLKSVMSIVEENLNPSIENYLAYVPLDIHSIAYDMDKQQLVGEAARLSLERRTVSVNNLPRLIDAAKRYNRTPKEYTAMIADKIGFLSDTRKD